MPAPGRISGSFRSAPVQNTVSCCKYCQTATKVRSTLLLTFIYGAAARCVRILSEAFLLHRDTVSYAIKKALYA